MEKIRFTAGIIITFGIGFLTNYFYDYIKNQKEYLKNQTKYLLGEYKLYWYSSTRIRNKDDSRISQAIIKIKKDAFLRIKVHFKEENLNNDNFDGFEYKGYLKSSDSKIHFIMVGLKHSDILYAIFEKKLSKQIEILTGLFLLTSNDNHKKPMAIKCLLSKDDINQEDIIKFIGIKDYLTIR